MNPSVQNLMGAWTPVGSGGYSAPTMPQMPAAPGVGGGGPGNGGPGGGLLGRFNFGGQRQPQQFGFQSRYPFYQLPGMIAPGVGTAPPLQSQPHPGFNWQGQNQTQTNPFRSLAGPGGAPARWPYLNSDQRPSPFAFYGGGYGGGQQGMFSGLPSMGGGWSGGYQQGRTSDGAPLGY